MKTIRTNFELNLNANFSFAIRINASSKRQSSLIKNSIYKESIFNFKISKSLIKYSNLAFDIATTRLKNGTLE